MVIVVQRPSAKFRNCGERGDEHLDAAVTVGEQAERLGEVVALGSDSDWHNSSLPIL